MADRDKAAPAQEPPTDQPAAPYAPMQSELSQMEYDALVRDAMLWRTRDARPKVTESGSDQPAAPSAEPRHCPHGKRWIADCMICCEQLGPNGAPLSSDADLCAAFIRRLNLIADWLRQGGPDVSEDAMDVAADDVAFAADRIEAKTKAYEQLWHEFTTGQKRIATLRDELAEQARIIAGTVAKSRLTEAEAECDRLRERCAELEQDAARLDWIERNAGICKYSWIDGRRVPYWMTNGERSLRDEIDAALARAAPTRGDGE